MKTILVPTDFSNSSINALKYAVEVAKVIEAKIVIAHVYLISALPGSALDESQLNLLQEEIKVAEQRLKLLKIQVKELAEFPVETITCPAYGKIEIPDVIQNQSADLTIMGTKGASGLKEIIFGSNTADVIKGSELPVLVVPEKVQYKQIRNIGFAYDHEPLTENLRMLTDIAKLLNASIQIFHIKDRIQNVDNQESSHEITLSPYLDGINCTYTSFYGANIEKGITEYIKGNDIDILAMMPRKHSLFSRLFKNSLTEKMAFHCEIPLLAIPE